MNNDIFTGYFDNSASTTGYFAYKADIIPATSTGQFTFSLFSNLTALNGLSFSGVSGKIYDASGNFIHSYIPNQELFISGNVFTGHANIFINSVPKNLNLIKPTGDVSGFFLNTGVLSQATLTLRGE